MASVLGELLLKITGDSKSLNTALDSSERRALKFAKQLQKAGDRIARAGVKLSLFVTLPLAAAGAAALKNAAEFEKQRVAFETLLGSADRAKALLTEIEEFSAATPFQLPGLIEGAKRLLAFGVAAEDIVPTMKSLGNAASGDQEKLDQLTLAFGKVRARGKASMREINMFINAGVPLVAQLAKNFDVTQEAVFKLVETGKVGFREVDQAIQDMTTGEGQFAGLIEKQAETLAGRFSTLKDNLGLLAKAFGEVVLPQVTNFVKKLTDLVQRFRALDENTKRTIITVVGIVAVVGPVLFIVGKLISIIGALQKAFIVARAAVIAFNIALASNPVLLAITIIAGLAAGIAILVGALNRQKRAQEEATEKTEEGTEAIDDQRRAILEHNVAVIDKEIEGVRHSIQVTKDRIAAYKEVGRGTMELERALGILQKREEGLLKAREVGVGAVRRLTGEMTEEEKAAAANEKGKKDYAEVVAKLNEAIAAAEERHKLYGYQVDIEAEKDKAVRAAIDDLIERGYKAEGLNIRTLIADYGHLIQRKQEYIDIEADPSSFLGLPTADAVAITYAMEEELRRIRLQERQKTADQIKQIEQGLLDFTLSVFTAIAQVSSNLTQQRTQEIDAELQARLDAIDRQKEALVESGEFTAEKEKEWDKEKADLEKGAEARKKQLAYEEAKRQQGLAVFQAIINTAAAIIKMLADPGGVAGVVLSIFAGITGAAQVIAIKSQPLPAFAEGADFYTRGPAAFIAGDNPGGVEHVQVTPVSSPNVSGPRYTLPERIIVRIGSREFNAYVEDEIDNKRILVNRRALKG